MAAGDEALRRKVWKLVLEMLLGSHPPDPEPGDLPTARPELARPRLAGPEGGARVTWMGHASALIQLPGLNILTDPVWSDRCSPLSFAGPRRFVPPPVPLEELPPIDVVLLSHDHYDHLDVPTVRALHRRFGEDLTWVTPLGYRSWFAGLGVTQVVERDWWETLEFPGGAFEAVAVPARHWTRRRPFGTNRRLWCGWVVRPAGEGTAGTGGAAHPAEGPRIYFAGDSGYCPAFTEIGGRLGPFDVTLMPVGAYEPRWFMAAAHMNPEDAVRAHRESGGQGHLIPIHWGTWRLTFEDPLEPPERMRRAWATAGLPDGRLHVLGHGGTFVLP